MRTIHTRVLGFIDGVCQLEPKVVECKSNQLCPNPKDPSLDRSAMKGQPKVSGLGARCTYVHMKAARRNEQGLQRLEHGDALCV